MLGKSIKVCCFYCRAILIRQNISGIHHRCLFRCLETSLINGHYRNKAELITRFWQPQKLWNVLNFKKMKWITQLGSVNIFIPGSSCGWASNKFYLFFPFLSFNYNVFSFWIIIWLYINPMEGFCFGSNFVHCNTRVSVSQCFLKAAQTRRHTSLSFYKWVELVQKGFLWTLDLKDIDIYTFIRYITD